MAAYGEEVVERGMEVMMMTPGIEQDYADSVHQAYTRETEQPVRQQPQIVRQDPYDGAIADEFGIVRELIPEVDAFRRLNIPNTDVGAALLGQLAIGRHAQITVHTKALADEDNSSFTFFISHQMLDQQGVIVGDFVTCRLRGFAIAGREPIRICVELHGAFG